MGFKLGKTLGLGGDGGRFLDDPTKKGNVINKMWDPLGLWSNSNGLNGEGGGASTPNAAGITQPAYQSQLDSPTYQAMQGQYASGSASPWANIAISRQGDLAEKQKQELAQRNSGQTAQSLDKLATVGGLTSGARERTIQAGQENYMTGVQDVGNAYKSNVVNIGIDDAQAKQGIGKGLMAAEIGDLTGKNSYNQNKYNTDMQTWAAKQQADATRASGGGGGGCYITTAACEIFNLPDDNSFLNTFRKFRDEYMGGKESSKVQKYYETAPKVLAMLGDKKSEVLHYVMAEYLVPCHSLIKQGRNKEAEVLYTDMVKSLEKEFLT